MLLYIKLRAQDIKYFCLRIFSMFWKEMRYFLFDQKMMMMVFLEFG